MYTISAFKMLNFPNKRCFSLLVRYYFETIEVRKCGESPYVQEVRPVPRCNYGNRYPCTKLWDV